jgi:hypothetical protein
MPIQLETLSNQGVASARSVLRLKLALPLALVGAGRRTTVVEGLASTRDLRGASRCRA